MIIDNSIQEKLEKINSRISPKDIVALFLITITAIGLLAVIAHDSNKEDGVVVYEEASFGSGGGGSGNVKPFGSKGGSTYTFSWCQGSTRILEKNKIYFTSERDAQQSGRTLSRMCH
jgi:hypothetical protein